MDITIRIFDRDGQTQVEIKGAESVDQTAPIPIKAHTRKRIKQAKKLCPQCNKEKGGMAFKDDAGVVSETCQKCLDTPSYRARVEAANRARVKRLDDLKPDAPAELSPPRIVLERNGNNFAPPPPAPIEDISGFAVKSLAPGEGLY